MIFSLIRHFISPVPLSDVLSVEWPTKYRYSFTPLLSRLSRLLCVGWFPIRESLPLDSSHKSDSCIPHLDNRLHRSGTTFYFTVIRASPTTILLGWWNTASSADAFYPLTTGTGSHNAMILIGVRHEATDEGVRYSRFRLWDCEDDDEEEGGDEATESWHCRMGYCGLLLFVFWCIGCSGAHVRASLPLPFVWSEASANFEGGEWRQQALISIGSVC